MKLVVYNSILDTIGSMGSRTCWKEIHDRFPQFSLKTLGSIYSWCIQRKVKRTHFRHISQDKMNEYYFRYCEETQHNKREHVILHLAHEVDYSPALMARIVLECHLRYTRYNREAPPKSVLSQLLKNTQLIDDPVLALEIDVCNVADDVYGPVVDTIKRSVGHEYEFLLTKKLEEADIAFEDEVQLRAKGYDKTPDFILPVPIAIEGRIVNWIESKASFGDPESHAGYLDSQYWSYLNRFGSGLVIYWFGFVDELDCHREKGVMLLDHLPADFVSLPHSTREQEKQPTGAAARKETLEPGRCAEGAL